MEFISFLVAIAGVVVAIVIHKLTARGPQVHFDAGKGILCRCLTEQVFKEGWGIITVPGKLRVSNQSVTIVDAQLSYKMDAANVRPSSKPMGDDFPPLFVFERVANDEAGITMSLPRRHFTTIKVVPGDGEREYQGDFTLGGNFAIEYSADFFGGKFSSIRKMYIPMLIRFEYEHNGHFYWTEDFEVPAYPHYNRGWTKKGPVYINGEEVAVFSK